MGIIVLDDARAPVSPAAAATDVAVPAAVAGDTPKMTGSTGTADAPNNDPSPGTGAPKGNAAAGTGAPKDNPRALVDGTPEAATVDGLPNEGTPVAVTMDGFPSTAATAAESTEVGGPNSEPSVVDELDADMPDPPIVKEAWRDTCKGVASGHFTRNGLRGTCKVGGWAAKA